MATRQKGRKVRKSRIKNIRGGVNSSINGDFNRYVAEYVRTYKKPNFKLLNNGTIVYFYTNGVVYIGTIQGKETGRYMKTSIKYGETPTPPDVPHPGTYSVTDLQDYDEIKSKNINTIIRIPLNQINELYVVNAPEFNYLDTRTYDVIRTAVITDHPILEITS
jgi:hypothetical protein